MDLSCIVGILFMLSLREAVLLEERRRENVRVRVLSTCDSHLPAFVESQMRSLTELSTKIAYGSCGKCHLRLNPRPQPFTEGKSRKDAERAANHPTGISCLSLPTKEAALLPVVPRQTADHTRKYM